VIQSRRPSWFVCLSWLLAAGFVCLGCADDEPAERDLQVRDDDAGRRSSGRDGAAPDDDDAGTTVVRAGDTVLCSFDSDDVFLGPSQLAGAELHSSGNARGFGQVYLRRDGTLFVRAIPLDGPANAERAVVAASEQPAAPTIVAGERDFVLGYRAGTTLWLKSLAEGPAASVMLTAALQAEAYALAATDGGFAVAYRADQADQVELRAFDEDLGARGEATVELPGSTHLGLAPIGDHDLVLGFAAASPSGELSVSGLRLGASLDAMGAAEQLSTSPPAQARFALAGRAASAGLLYATSDGGVREALKLRRIGAGGAPEGPLLNVADAPRRVSAGAIAAFGQGFAVVYRELPSLGVADEAVRIAFVNQFGAVVHDAALVDHLGAESLTSVAVSGQQVLASVVTGSAEGSELRTIRLDCAGALVLCGGSLQ
jgi:hypothetical protein